eukprot:g4538.t1
MREMGPNFSASPYRRSRHPAIINPEVLEQSATYCKIRSLVQKRFPSFRVGYSIANLYRDGKDWTEMHRDHFSSSGRGDGKKETGEEGGTDVDESAAHDLDVDGQERNRGNTKRSTHHEPAHSASDQKNDTGKEKTKQDHNVTIGVSFGATRSLAFKHLKTGREFSFEQHDGDLFAFTTPVNSTFQHSIPLERQVTDPRISLIFWGRVKDEKLI